MRRYATLIALGLGVALVVYPIARTSEITGVTAIGGAGLAFLALALSWGRARALRVLAVILIALHYPLALHAAHLDLDVYSVLVALGLYALFETSDLSIAVADTAPMTRPALAARATTTGSIAATGALLAVLTILARSLFSAGLLGVIVGAICALGMIALSLWLALGGSRPAH